MNKYIERGLRGKKVTFTTHVGPIVFEDTLEKSQLLNVVNDGGFMTVWVIDKFSQKKLYALGEVKQSIVYSWQYEV